MIQARSALLAAVALAAASSVVMAADTTWYVSPTVTAGTGAGTVGSPYGSLGQAYASAFSTSGNQTIQLLDGTYLGAHIGSDGGNAGSVNIVQGGGAPTATSITIQGNAANNGAVVLSGAGDSGTLSGTGMFDFLNGISPTGGLTMQNLTAQTVGGERQNFITVNANSSPITFNNTNIHLGYSSGNDGMFFYNIQTTFTHPEFTFDNSNIYIGRPAGQSITLSNPSGSTTDPYNEIATTWQGNTTNTDVLIMDGTDTSRVYDSNGNLITDLTQISLLERSTTNTGSGGYAPYYENGQAYPSYGATTGNNPGTEFLNNFLLTPAEAPVPEPASLALLASGGLLLLRRRKSA